MQGCSHLKDVWDLFIEDLDNYNSMVNCWNDCVDLDAVLREIRSSIRTDLKNTVQNIGDL